MVSVPGSPVELISKPVSRRWQGLSGLSVQSYAWLFQLPFCLQKGCSFERNEKKKEKLTVRFHYDY